MGGACCNKKAEEEPVKEEKNSFITKLINTSKTIDEFKKTYEYISILGNGAYGTVKLYRSSKNNSVKFAVKTVNKTILDYSSIILLQNEVKIMKRLDHPNIVKFYETYEDEVMLNIVMEYISGDNLTKICNKQKSKILNEKDSSKILTCLLKTLDYIHNSGIIHRDIKPSNILFRINNNYESLKLIDYGVSMILFNREEEEENKESNNNDNDKDNNKDNKNNENNNNIANLSPPTKVRSTSHSKQQSIIKISYKDVYGKENYQYKNQNGTPYFMSPESIKGEPCEKSDLWSIGVLLYLLLTGELPFRGDKKEKIFSEICSCHYNKNAIKNNFSEEVQDLISKLLTIDLKKRPNAKEALEHPWFSIYADNNNKQNCRMDKEVISNIINFQGKDVFQKEVSFFLAKLSASGNEISKLDQIFKELDIQNTGFIEYKDLFDNLQKIGLDKVSKNTYLYYLINCIIEID